MIDTQLSLSLAVILFSVHLVDLGLDVEDLNQVLGLLVGLVADANSAGLYSEDGRLLGEVAFSVPVEDQLKRNEFLGRVSHILAHGVLLADLVLTCHTLVDFAVTTLGWGCFVELDDLGVVLAACHVALLVESNAAQSLTVFEEFT